MNTFLKKKGVVPCLYILLILLVACEPVSGPNMQATPVPPSWTPGDLSPTQPILNIQSTAVPPSSTPGNITPTQPVATIPPFHTETQSQINTITPLATGVPSINSTIIPEVLHSDWTSYTNANYIRVMLIDREGNLWTGGSGGAVKWDVKTGSYVKFTAEHGLAGNFVTALAQTVDGAIWFGTRGSGLSRFDGKNWTTFTTKSGLPSNDILSILVGPDGSLWVDTERDQFAGAPGGLARYEAGSWIPYKGAFDVMAVSPDGTLWGGVYGHPLYKNGGLWRYDGIELKPVTSLPDKNVTALAVAPDGALWVGTETAVFRYDGYGWEGMSPWHDTDAKIEAIAIEPNGTVWLGLCRELRGVENFDREVLMAFDSSRDLRPPAGVYQYKDGKWELFRVQDGLVDNEIRSIVVGDDGNIWFGSFNRGVSRFDGTEWTTYQTRDKLLSNDITSLAVSDQAEVWVGHVEGASSFDGLEWNIYPQIGQLRDNFVIAIHIDLDQTIWFGTSGGLAVFDGSDWKTYDVEQYEWLSFVDDIVSLPGGGHLLGTNEGVVSFDGQIWEEIVDFDVDKILLHPDSSWWFITNFDGIYSYDGFSWSHYTSQDGLASDYVYSAAVTSEGALLFGTCNGISRYEGNQWFMDWASDEIFDCVNDIVTLKDGTAWAGTYYGLLYYDGQSWKDMQLQGLASQEVSKIALGSDGTIWVATNGGLSRYRPISP
jgi:ligand-binding sensor domain-containing protein